MIYLVFITVYVYDKHQSKPNLNKRFDYSLCGTTLKFYVDYIYVDR